MIKLNKAFFVKFASVILTVLFTNSMAAQQMEWNELEWQFEEQELLVSPMFDLPDFTEQPFGVLNLTVNGAHSTEGALIQYRISKKEHGGANKFMAWQELKADEHTGRFENKVLLEQLYLDLESKRIQFRITNLECSGSINGTYYFPGKTSSITTTSINNCFGARGANCTCAIPAYANRLGWCPSGNCPEDPTPVATTVSHVVVHHSAGVNMSNDWAAVVRSIWNFHTNTNGWDDIGYNYLIDPNGIIYEGRGNNTIGAHFSCMNANTMGVCLLGNFETAQPTAAMLDALTELIGWKECEVMMDPTLESYNALAEMDLYNVCGHRDGNTSTSPNSCATGTVCPGNNVYNLLPQIRSAVSNYMTDCTLDNYSDIIILSMDAMPVQPEVGENVLLEVTLRNAGSAAINDAFSVSWQINGAVVENELVNQLAVNATVDLSYSFTFSEAKEYDYCIFAGAATNELNTLNNSFCKMLTVVDSVDITIATIDQSHTKVGMFPNPAKDFIRIESEEEISTLIIYNAQGQRVLETKQTDFIAIHQLVAGMYVVEFNLESGVIRSKLLLE